MLGEVDSGVRKDSLLFAACIFCREEKGICLFSLVQPLANEIISTLCGGTYSDSDVPS